MLTRLFTVEKCAAYRWNADKDILYRYHVFLWQEVAYKLKKILGISPRHLSP